MQGREGGGGIEMQQMLRGTDLPAQFILIKSSYKSSHLSFYSAGPSEVYTLYLVWWLSV